MISGPRWGDPNASIPRRNQSIPARCSGAYGSGAPACAAVTFYLEAAQSNSVCATDLACANRPSRCKNTRNIGKSDLIHKLGHPQVEVNPETYEFAQIGELLNLRAR